ncbi:MAG: Transposase family, partial [Verrucomicrobia bacterium]|nr:Transposase family [Verrucomicrobiota bacterium]
MVERNFIASYPEPLTLTAPRTAGWLLRQVQALYQVEARLRAQRAGPRLRQAVRAAESQPVIRRLEQALIRLKAKGRYLPQSPLGQALDYALGQWTTL